MRSTKTKVTLVLLASVLISVFAGCSGSSQPSQPSAEDGEKLIRNKIQNQAQGRITLVSFRKTNGQKTETFGRQGYVLEWEAEILFVNDCYWGPFDFGGWKGDFYASAEEPELFMPDFRREKARKGQKTTVSGRLGFEKTEKGWRGEDGKIY